MDSHTSSSSVLEPELYFLIARFLSAGPCQRTAKVLLEELEEFKLLPRRVDWEGNEHFRSYDNLVYLNRHIRPDHLLRIVERVGTLVDKEVKSSVPGVKSLLGAGTLSILRTAEDLKHTKWVPAHHAIRHHGAPLYPPANLAAPPVPHVLQAYQMSGALRQHSALPTSVYSKISMYGRKLGHLSAVYCVLFDRTGNFIFTGADDALVKIWSVFDMRLLATLRGHSAEITDMAVSFENTHLASGSCDKVVRVWCLRSKAPAAVLQGHSSMITSVQFCPKIQGDQRYLVSTGNDGCVCFWHYNISSNEFSPKPIKFIEKSRAGAQMLCSSFSPGGAFLATGNSDHVVRVYFLHAAGPEKICELEAHTDKVDSICYSNHLNRFVSGSNDGTARIWRLQKHEWRATVLNMAATLQSPSSRSSVPRFGCGMDQMRVTMVSWSMDDARVITAASDLTIKIWNSHTGTLLQVLEGHEDEVYVLEACPSDSRILLSAGHDGKMIVWDIETGTKIKKFFNLIEGQGHGAVFDCKFSPDGHSLAATDSHGHMLLLGFGTNERCKKLPQQLFFHTDYRPLMRDANNYVLDEQTQQPPHLMPPPFLVDIDGNPYPASIQRSVPGRENCTESSLIPQMAVNAQGESEVIGDRDNGDGHGDDQGDSSGTEDESADGAGDARPASVSGSRGGNRPVRPSIDVMIQELQRRQDRGLGGEQPGPSRQRNGSGSSQGPLVNGEARSPPPMASPPAPRSSNMQNRIGMRRSGEIEGVRQSLGPVAVRSTKKERDAWRRRVTVKPLDDTALQLSEQKRQAYSEEEVKRFLLERKKNIPSPFEKTTSATANKGRRQNKKKSALGFHSEGEVADNEETARNRLTTRALYDTEEEEDEGGGSDLDVWASDSNSSDDYSDWVGDQGSSNLEPPKRRSKRKVKRRRLSSSDDGDIPEEADEDTEVQDSSSDDDDDEDGSSDEEMADSSSEKPGTSIGRRDLRQKTVKKKTASKQKQKASKTKTRKPDLAANIPPIKELDERMRPPEWITTVIPRKAPFVPQMGDEVIYFRQGHEQYLQAVVRKDVYPVDLTRNQPWHKIPQLRAQELVKIVGIKWLLKPTRLCCLKLGFIDTNTGKLTGKSFTIKYHDMPDVIDFLVLKQHYDISVERGWKPGTKFRSMIDDQWWIGVIRSQEPLDLDFPDSLYQCFNVHWDNGEYEKLSPWDMEPVDQKRKPSQVGGGVDVTPEEYKQLLYVPKKTEWTSLGREAESARLITGMEMLMQHSFAEPFIAPVDLQQFPTYACFVPYPMDLNTIKARLENGFYRRVTALQWDIRLIFANASIFNQSGSTIVKNANVLTEALLRFIKDHGCQDPMPLLSELAHGGIKTCSSEEDSQHSSATSRKRTPDGQWKKRRKSKSKVKANPDAWLEQSESLLAMLFDCEDSEPFRVPVDPAQYLDYEDIVSNPMDLTTVHTKLATGHYGNPVDMSKDMRLIFTNSKLYNTNKRSRIYSMTLRLSALFEDQISHIISRWKSALRASGRVQRLNSRHRSKSSAAPPQPSSDWNVPVASVIDASQPSSSQAGNPDRSKAPLTNGFGTGSLKADSGDDSDATIVEDNKHVSEEDDSGGTEVYEERHNGRGGKGSAAAKRVEYGEEESEDSDGDYEPSKQFKKNHGLEGSPSKTKGKFFKRGKEKSSKPLPARAASGRFLKSNIFYTSDGNEQDDDEDVPNFAIKKEALSRLQDSGEKNSSDEDSDTLARPQPTKSLSRKSISRSKAPLKKGSNAHRSKSSRSEDIPSHRKARGARSRDHAIDSEEEEEKVSPANSLKRSARSARLQRKYYNDGDSEDQDSGKDQDVEIGEEEEEDGETNKEESEEESSSTVIDEDSEDELITQSLQNESSKPESKTFTKKNRRRIRKISHSEDSDSDTAVPRKRVRLRSVPKSSPKQNFDVKASETSKKKGPQGKKRGPKVQTRNRGRQRVTYLEDDTDEEDRGDEGEDRSDNSSDKDSECDDDMDDHSQNVSSRGRVRKLTARAKACLKNS
ncbi:bromodomain and WD repeat-containing protein 3 [Aplysia californica]|uniref:Bromodomain and WD repeat-containing protein 3 n=1 Tax=Aplysia californica TaxID=6500 RepID=A0ABM0JYR9_APLCA|nr:bromodomain and WD repeat-containing protein 3 [Aplysia californica]